MTKEEIAALKVGDVVGYRRPYTSWVNPAEIVSITPSGRINTIDVVGGHKKQFMPNGSMVGSSDLMGCRVYMISPTETAEAVKLQERAARSNKLRDQIKAEIQTMRDLDDLERIVSLIKTLIAERSR